MKSSFCVKVRWLLLAVTAAAGWPLTDALAAGAGPLQGPAQPPRTRTEILEGAGELRNPETRRRVVEELDRIGRDRRVETEALARLRGWPLRVALPNGGARELMDFDGDQPLYYATCNVNAGISSGANLLWAAPYNMSGSGGTVGLWDASSARTTHREFGARVRTMDGSSATVDHSTHVAGTISASGYTASAKGMAPAVSVDSYDWTGDLSEMTSRGASYPGEADKIYISSHSYGYSAGWAYTATPAYTWYGSGTTAAGIANDFGMYSATTRDTDALAYSLPYYLIFWAAGNDRGDNPSAGASVSIGGSTVAYDPALHPPGDSVYRGGYDTLSYYALAKNVVTVGAVGDAVSGGVRGLSGATMTSFSSWGPTDDGRIKPDLVANGYSLYSSLCGSDAAYGYMSGTSMATPSAAGTAQLLVSYYGALFPGQCLRASTLKGLLIHTASDLGTAGPDYQYGWGLINAKAAADLIASVATNSAVPRLAEQQLTPSAATRTHSFAWDGVSPIRVTLCWTDPAGAATTAADSRTTRLMNNLNLRVVGPAGTQHLPYVMPFVGAWTVASMSAAATTGTNNTDNVEQVYVAAPPAAGTYQAVISYSGTLVNNQQNYALLISGSASSSPAPQSVSPNAAVSGALALTVAGEAFASGATVAFVRDGYGDVPASVTSVTSAAIGCTVDVTWMAAGVWGVRVTNPDGKSGTLASAFTARAPSVTAVSPDLCETGAVAVTVSGQFFAAGSAVTFLRAGQPDVSASVSSVTSNALACVVDVTSMAKGPWNVRVTNPGEKSGTRQAAFTVVGTLLSQGFDPGAPGWSASANIGSTYWALTTLQSQTPPNCYFASGPASKNTDNLLSEGFAISPTAQRLRLHFWHKYTTEAYDGGLLELSPNSGTNWYEIGAGGSGASFAQGGYAATIQGRPQGGSKNQAELVGKAAWTGAGGGAFTEVVVALDQATYGGKTLRARWRLSTDSSTASSGWYVDSVRISGYDTDNAAPTVTLAASADPATVTNTTTALGVTADDDRGEAALTYTWSVNETPGHAVSFSVNGSNAAKRTTASFSAPGDYTFVVAVSDAEGLTATSAVAVAVQATPTSVRVLPAAAEVETGRTKLFAAAACDQFGLPLDPQPAFAWNVSGGGTIDAGGLFTAGAAAGGPYAVTASAVSLDGSAQVTVVYPPPVYWTLGVSAVPLEGGTVTGAGLYENGMQAPIAALPAEGWFFTRWTGEGLSDTNAATATVLMNTNKTVTAHFATNTAPAIITAASADPATVTNTTTALGVTADDDRGEAALTYTWSVSDTPGHAVTFSVNGNNAAKRTTATFSAAGDYTLVVAVRDAEGLTATGAVRVAVQAAPTLVTVLPAAAEVETGQSKLFAAEAYDQFSLPLDPRPAFAWSASGGGTIDANGLFTAGAAAGGPHTVTASAVSLEGAAKVTVVRRPSVGTRVLIF